MIRFIESKEVPVRELKPHPHNPNRGDVNSIAESLEEFGQYRSVVALVDGTLLAGHHVVQAAKNIGLKSVRVDFIEADEQTAQKILLADNRLADLGEGPELERLLKNLEDLEGDLVGTGFDEEYVRLLTEAITGPDEKEDDPEDEGPGGVTALKRISLVIEAKLADHWEAHRKMFPDDSSAFGYLLD